MGGDIVDVSRFVYSMYQYHYNLKLFFLPFPLLFDTCHHLSSLSKWHQHTSALSHLSGLHKLSITFRKSMYHSPHGEQGAILISFLPEWLEDIWFGSVLREAPVQTLSLLAFHAMLVWSDACSSILLLSVWASCSPVALCREPRGTCLC